MKSQVRQQILGVVENLDKALDQLNGMMFSWWTDDDMRDDLEEPENYIRAAREMLKVLTTK